MATELEADIKTNAQGPAQVSGDAGSIRQHSLKDQIEADRYLEAKKAVRGSGLGIKFVKLIPPGV